MKSANVLNQDHLVLISLHADPVSASGFGGAGGTHAYVRELMVGLTTRGWRLTILTRWTDQRLLELEVISPSVKIVRLRIGDVGPLDKRLLDDLHSDSLAAASEVLQAGDKVSLLHSVYWNSGRVAMDIGKIFGLPFVHTVISNGWRRRHHGYETQSPSRLEVETRVFTRAFAIFCISGEERDDLIEHYSVSPDKIIVVGRPVGPTFLHPCRDEWGCPSWQNWSNVGL